MRMVSACTKMHELSAEGITSNIYQDLKKKEKVQLFKKKKSEILPEKSE